VPIQIHSCECVSHLSFCPAHGFPNNWKIDGDYPPAGGQRNSFFGEKDVAQIGNLLYRGLAIRMASETKNDRRLPVGDTADWQSALHGLRLLR
jgi:hypothetical protein